MRIKLSVKEYLRSPITYVAAVVYFVGGWSLYQLASGNTLLLYGLVILYAFTVISVFRHMIVRRAYIRLVESVLPRAKLTRDGDVDGCPYCRVVLRKSVLTIRRGMARCAYCDRIFKVVES